MNYKEIQQGTYSYKLDMFDSIGDLISTINSRPSNQFFLGEHLSSQKFSTDRWSGTATYSEAAKLLETGWSPEAEKLAKRIPVQTVSANVKNSRQCYSVVGYQASVPRYLQGIPTSMITRTPDVKKQKIITLNKDLSYAAYWSAQQIEEEGIKALQVIQALEGRGYRVKMNMIFLTNSSTEVLGSVLCVKKPEERMSLIKIAFPLAHPGMLRRMMFRWLETNPNMTKRGYIYGYGMPVGHRYIDLCGKGEYLIPTQINNVEKFVEDIIKGL
jgi:hypothetical protein